MFLREPFRVRYSECDAYGHLNNANYLRWMKEVSMQAGQRQGVLDNNHENNGQAFITMKTNIEYLLPLAYGDPAEVTMVSRNVGDNFLAFSYRIVNSHTQKTAARAETINVCNDGDTQKIEEIKDRVNYIAFPSGSKSSKKTSSLFFNSPAPPIKPFSMQREVEWRDIDGRWLLDDAVLLSYMEDAGVRVCDAYGWSVKRMAEAGFGLIARQHRVDAHARAQLGESLEISTWFSDVKASTVLRHYTIRRLPHRELVARAWTRWVWVNLTTGRPIRAPGHFLKDLAANRSPAA